MTMKTRTTTAFGIGLPAILLVAAGGWHGLTGSSRSAQPARHPQARQIVTTSCESVGAWCYDEQQAALKRAERSRTVLAPARRSTASCESVGAWCYDAQQAALKKSQGR